MTLNATTTNAIEARQEVYHYVRIMLGEGIIDTEADVEHLDVALNRTLARFRQRSPNAVEESYSFLTLQKDVNDYVLPQEVTNVQSVFRRALGSRTGGGTGTNLDPFSTAYQNVYLLNSNMMGGLATYFCFASYQELLGKMFGFFIEFQWIHQSRILRLLQRPFSDGEVIMLRTQNFRPDFNLISDIYAGQWIKDYTLATVKTIIGQARSKFSQIAGPSGGSSLNGAALLQEGIAELEKLDKELETLIPGGTGYTFVIG